MRVPQPPASGTTQDELAARSLLPSKRDIRGAATFNRTILGDVSATLNTEIEHNEGRSLIGLGDTSALVLGRNTRADTAHAGIGLNGTKADWHWTVTGNADLEHDVTSTDRNNPDFPQDRARQTRESGDLTAIANGNLFKLPAGNASTTLTVGASTTHQSSARLAAAIELTFTHSRAHAAALRLYLLSQEGQLKVEDEPVRLINAAIERSTAGARAGKAPGREKRGAAERRSRASATQ